MRIDAILLELDGVVADTYALRRRAHSIAWALHGVIISRDEYWELCAGLSTDHAVRAVAHSRNMVLDPTDLDLVAARADREFTKGIGTGISLVDGARSTLEKLASECRLAVVSALRRREVDAILALGQLDDLFAFSLSAEDSRPPKPAPAGYQMARDRLTRLGAQRIVALEHGAAGIAAARAAAIDVIAVGAQPAHVLVNANAWLPALESCSSASLARILTSSVE